MAENLRGMLRKGEWQPGFYDGRKAVEQPGIDKTSGIVKDLGRDLTADAEQGKFDPIIGREDEILAMMKILTGRRKNNPILVGDAGVGKTAVVEGLAQVIVSEGVMPELKGKRIRTVEMVAVVAGAQLLGQFEQKLQSLIKEAEADPNLILFIDEIHTLMGARGGAMGAADILKPALSGGKMKCIGATTQEEYRKHFEKDKALARRFQPVFIDEPTKDETLEILWGLRPKYEEFHGAKILDEAIQGAVELSMRYIGDRHMPDKAIDVIDQACSNKKLRMFYGLSELGELTKQERRDLFSGKKGAPAAKTSMIISFEDVARIVAEWTGIPVGKLKEKEAVKLLELEALIGKRIVGQDEAVKAIAQSIRTSRSGMGDPKRPLGSFLFLGPTGVGKTELAKTLAGILFEDEERLIQLDMSEFYEKHTISRLTGSPPGYVDSDQGGQLTEAVKKQPYAVVLFDEIEKAHPDVLRILLQILEEGRLTDGLGRSVNFRNTVVVMTSNIGSDRISDYRPLGVDLRSKEDRDKGVAIKDIRGDIEKELKRRFSPEFMNRIDEVVIFNPLSRGNLPKYRRGHAGEDPHQGRSGRKSPGVPGRRPIRRDHGGPAPETDDRGSRRGASGERDHRRQDLRARYGQARVLGRPPDFSKDPRRKEGREKRGAAGSAAAARRPRPSHEEMSRQRLRSRERRLGEMVSEVRPRACLECKLQNISKR